MDICRAVGLLWKKYRAELLDILIIRSSFHVFSLGHLEMVECGTWVGYACVRKKPASETRVLYFKETHKVTKDACKTVR